MVYSYYTRAPSQPVSALSTLPPPLTSSSSKAIESKRPRNKAPSSSSQRGRALARTGNSSERRLLASAQAITTTTTPYQSAIMASSFPVPADESEDLLFDDIESEFDSDPTASSSSIYFQSRAGMPSTSSSTAAVAFSSSSSKSSSSSISTLCTCFESPSYSAFSPSTTGSGFSYYDEQSEYAALLRSQTPRATQRRVSSSSSYSSTSSSFSSASWSAASNSSLASMAPSSSTATLSSSGTATTPVVGQQASELLSPSQLGTSLLSASMTSTSSTTSRTSRRRQRRLKDFEDRLAQEEQSELFKHHQDEDAPAQEQSDTVVDVALAVASPQKPSQRTEYFYINAENLPEARSVPEYEDEERNSFQLAFSHPAYDDYYTFKPHVLIAKLEALLLASPSLSPSSSDITLPELSEGSASSSEDEDEAEDHGNEDGYDINSDDDDEDTDEDDETDVDEYLLTTTTDGEARPSVSVNPTKQTALPVNPLVRIRSDKYAADEHFEARFERAIQFADMHQSYIGVGGDHDENRKAVTVVTRGRQRQRASVPTKRTASDTVRQLIASLA